MAYRAAPDPRIAGLLRRLVREVRGSVAVLAALVLPVALALGAVAVDVGAMFLEYRHAQQTVDLAAIAAAAGDGDAAAIAAGVIEGNGIGAGHQLTVEPGRYRGDAALPPALRFEAGTGAGAVRVSLRKPARIYFASLFTGPPEIAVSAVAARRAEAAFSVGSRLAALDGGVINALLGGLLGTTVSLSAVDYQALLGADIRVLGMLDALAVELGVTAGSYAELLALDASVGQVVSAMRAVALATPGQGAAAHALGQVLAVPGLFSIDMPLQSFLDLGSVGGLAVGSGAGSGLDLSLDALEMLTAAAVVADGSGQVSLNLSLGVPGIAGVQVMLAVGEPMQSSGWFAVGEAGAMVHTAQVRLRVVASLLGGGVLSGLGITLPLYIEAAQSTARLDAVDCPGGGAVVAARPGVVSARLGTVSPAALADFSVPPQVSSAVIVDALLVRVRGSAEVEVASAEWQAVPFSASEIGAGTVKTVTASGLTGSLLGSLMGELNLTVDLLAIPLLPLGTLTSALGGVVAGAAAPIDGALSSLLAALGLSLGQADLRVHGLACQGAVLVG